MSAASTRRIAVVGAGWAGLAAAVEATASGQAVTLFEMAPQLGGRARSVVLEADGLEVDNGQHILIGAYTATLGLMRRVGADPEALLRRLPLALVGPDGRGLVFEPGLGPQRAFVRAVASQRGWSLADRVGLLAAAAVWRLRGFRCDDRMSVAQLARRLTPAVRRELIEPLCVAALNTPAAEASASVFLRVLRDALFAAPGASDLLLPRVPLGALLPGPAGRWLEARGASVRTRARVRAIERRPSGWDVDGERFDAVVLAASTPEAARLVAPFAAAWARQAEALRHSPIVTVYARAESLRLTRPMLALTDGPEAPAQFAFDLSTLRGGPPGLLALVASGAARWVERGLEATVRAALDQAEQALGTRPAALQAIVEKRATFACVPGLVRPPMRIAPGLLAAGDGIEGPYPATLEGAVRSGLAAGRAPPMEQ